MSSQTEEPIAESDRMLREAVAALTTADAELIHSDLKRFELPDWSDLDEQAVWTHRQTPLGKPRSVEPNASDPLLDSQEELRIVLGTKRIDPKDLYELNDAALLVLESPEEELVELYAGESLLAKGEVVCLDGRICFRVVEIIDRRPPSP